MKRVCSRETELMEAMQLGHWPAAASEDLRAHVAGCDRCADAAAVGAAMLRDRAAMMPVARLQAPGVLWWRAQLRRREAAMEQIARPMRGVQVLVAVMAVLAVVGFVVEEVWSGGAWLARVSSVATQGGLLTIVVAAGLMLLVGSVAVLLVFDRKER